MLELGLASESSVLAAALALGAGEVAGWSDDERRLVQALAPARVAALPSRGVAMLVEQIRAGQDPLGDALQALRAPAERRAQGATYTPAAIVDAMASWAEDNGPAARVVDPGCGTARFLCVAGNRFPESVLCGVELDPRVALIARGNLAAAGHASRAHIDVQDYRAFRVPEIDGATLFLGNPPYTRHHQIPSVHKHWLSDSAGKLGLKASQRAGLHVHFILATALQARAGDFGAFITAAEWLDVNYGQLVRELFLGVIGGSGIAILDPEVAAFPGRSWPVWGRSCWP